MVIAFVVMWKPFPRRDKWIEGERENKGRQLVLRTTDPRSIFDIEHFEKNKNLRGKLKGELLDHFLDHYSPTNKSREPQRKQYRSVNQYHLSLSLSLYLSYTSYPPVSMEEESNCQGWMSTVSSIEEETLSGQRDRAPSLLCRYVFKRIFIHTKQEREGRRFQP